MLCHLHDANTRSHIDISFTFALNQVLTSTNAVQAHQTENINAIYSLWCNYYWKENYFLNKFKFRQGANPKKKAI